MSSLTNGIGFLIKGGPVMWPLFICAILAVTVMIERFIAISKASSDSEELLDKVKEYLVAGNVKEALKTAEASNGPVASIFAAGIRSKHLDSDGIERTMEEFALRETPMLYKRLGILDTIITIAPLLGLLGTVTGMIKSFHVVGTAGLNNSFGITSGVAEALIATATGLAIAIITLIGYNYLTEKVKEVIAEMEIRATQLMNILANLPSSEGRVINEAAQSRA